MTADATSLDRLLNRGFRYALSLVRERSRAEDLVQESCARIARRGGPWRVAYMLTTIRNLHVDECRRQQTVRFHSLESTREPLQAAEPEGGVDDAMHRALGRLREEERELIFLSAVEGYTATEIAELTGRPRGTVLSSIHRAKEKLRLALGSPMRASAHKASERRAE